jgi:hypothetical protein
MNRIDRGSDPSARIGVQSVPTLVRNAQRCRRLLQGPMGFYHSQEYQRLTADLLTRRWSNFSCIASCQHMFLSEWTKWQGLIEGQNCDLLLLSAISSADAGARCATLPSALGVCFLSFPRGSEGRTYTYLVVGAASLVFCIASCQQMFLLG